MNEIEDIRWQQRFENYVRSVDLLVRAAASAGAPDATDIDQLALIKCWEMAHELAWNLLKDYLTAEGHVGLMGSRSTTRMAIEFGLLPAGPLWMDMIDCRNITVHAYDEHQAEQIARHIQETFVEALIWLRTKFAEMAAGGPA